MNKIVLITGATSGIGFATLEKLVDEGHTVYGTGRKQEDLKKIETAGGRPLQMEMTDHRSIEAALQKLLDSENGIDVLFNNAGYGLYGTVEEVPIEAAKHQFEVNLFGLAHLTQLVVPHMRAAGRGTIINTSSMGGRIYTPFGAWYHATKHALEGWSDCLAYELEPFGIDVVIIEPGTIKTPWGATLQNSLIKYSGDGPYGERARTFAERSKEAYGSNEGSDPSVIADAVSKAIASNNPKRRYPAGKYARLSIYTRRFLGDKVYDFVVKQMSK